MHLPIRGLGTGGMVSDLPAYDLQPNQLTRAVNVDLRDGAITRAWGFARESDVSEEAVWFEGWFSQGNGRMVVISDGQYNAVFEEIEGGVATNIDPTTPLPAGGNWDSCVFGKSAVFTNGADPPMARSVDDNGPIDEMPNWPTGWTADMIRPYRNFLVALRVSRDNDYDDTRIQWSNASGNNELPPDWDSLDPASLAGGTSLAGQSGPIQDAATLGQSLIIYMQTAAYAMALGGGTVMTIRPLFNQGLLARRCVITFDVMHFCIGNGLIYVNDGSSVQYPAEEIVNTQFFAELADPSSIHLAHDASRKTIEIYYKTDVELAYANRVLRWRYQQNKWTFNYLDGFQVVRAIYAPDSQRLTSWDSVDNDIGGGSQVVWNGMGGSWQDLDLVAGRLSLKLLVRTAVDSAVMRREPAHLRDGQPFLSIAEREFIDFDDMIQGDPGRSLIRDTKHVKGIVPQVQGNGTIYFQFGTAATASSGTVWGPIVPYVLGVDYKVDFRASGRYFAWRVYNDVETPVTFRLSGFDVDVDLAGAR
jgi:hypothetical protein